MVLEMKKQLFGTDGIRGVAGQYPLDDKTVYAAGLALARFIRESAEGPSAETPEVVVGMDTRESSMPLARRLAAGLEKGGVRARCAGVITTAGVAYLTARQGFACGVMISASHNSFQDNGIKVFSPTGFKLPDDQEAQVEQIIFQELENLGEPSELPLETEPVLAQDYLRHLLSVDGAGNGFGPIKLIVDCANGAASKLAAQLFQELGTSAEIVCCEPDGRNINQNCGSLHMEELQKQVVEQSAELGVAFDGDADRALFVAEDGSIVDGDAILLMAAEHFAQANRLTNNLVVTTIMANMGLEKALEEKGLRMVRTPVGDKYVLEEMVRSGAALGGEQSGHIIFREYATTGDGLLTARMILRIMAESKQPLSALKNGLKVFPQKLKNIRVKHKRPIEEVPALRDAVAQSEKELGQRGRVIVRYSGTEPLVRIMVEAEEMPLVDEHIKRLAGIFQAQLGA